MPHWFLLHVKPDLDEIFSSQLSHGIDINVSDGMYRTALTRAILIYETECAKYVLKNGGNPICGNGDVLLHVEHSSLEKLEILLEAIDIHAMSPQKLCEWITGRQHSSAWDQEMGAVKVFECFLDRGQR